MELQGDGNLVLYPSLGAAVWASGTNGSGAARLVMQDDGDLVLETAAGVSVWSTSTGQSGGGGGGGGGTSAAVVHATKGGVNLTKAIDSAGRLYSLVLTHSIRLGSHGRRFSTRLMSRLPRVRLTQ